MRSIALSAFGQTKAVGPHKVKRLAWAILCLLPYCLFGQISKRASMTIQAQADSQPVRWQATYTTIYAEDAPKTALTLGPGLQLQNGASIVTDPALMLPGTASIRLKSFGTIATNAGVVLIAGNRTYIVEFKYRILSFGSS